MQVAAQRVNLSLCSDNCTWIQSIFFFFNNHDHQIYAHSNSEINKNTCVKQIISRLWIRVELCTGHDNGVFVACVKLRSGVMVIFHESTTLVSQNMNYELMMLWMEKCISKIQWYSTSQEICTRFCCALLCCGYAIVHNEFTWSIYPYSSGLLCWQWGNR